MEQAPVQHLKAIVGSLPELPGCYQYLDESGTIIYVGKAKNLKRRVSSYFNREHDNFKTSVLVTKIHDIKYIVVNTEEDALLLENNLIKQWNPRYNILLKDGKTYPSICITNEYLPRIIYTRKIDKRLGTFFGPYSHIPTLQALLELIKNLYPLRRCRESISAESIRNGKHKLCLEYHIKNCKGPCCGLQSREEYLAYINEAREILKGNTGEIERQMLAQMQSLAEEMRFEEAEAIKKQVDEVTVKIKAKAGDNGKLFGSVTSKEIAEQIVKELGITIDRKKMNVADIKNFGEYTAEIKLYVGIIAKITVKVTE